MDQGEESLVEADEDEKMNYLSSFAAGNAPQAEFLWMFDTSSSCGHLGVNVDADSALHYPQSAT